MPLYEYQCTECGKKTEVLQRFQDAPLEVCPACGGAVRKLVSSPAFQFKGSGWYITDYARKGGPAAGGEAGGSDKSAGAPAADGAEGAKGAAAGGNAGDAAAKAATPAGGGDGSGASGTGAGSEARSKSAAADAKAGSKSSERSAAKPDSKPAATGTGSS